MSRFLFTTLGSLGDLYPYIAVARALRERGHQAAIAAAEEYGAAVQGAGIEFAPVRPGLAELGDYQSLIIKLFDRRRGPEYLIRHLVMPYLRSAYEQLLQASAGADLLISHPLTFTLPLVAQRRGLPWVATVLAPMSFMSCYDPPVIAAAPWLQILRVFGPIPYRWLFSLLKRSAWNWEAPLRDLRRDLGLPPAKQLALFEGQFSPLYNLALFDPPLAEPQPDWPVPVRLCGAPVYDESAPEAGILDDLESFLSEGEAPIVFALGSSVVWLGGDFWDKAVTAVQALGRRAILITGPVLPEHLPEGVRAFPYLPYSKVFPRAAAVVHPVGIGTLAQALRAGCPQLLVPVAFDQPDNAHRAAALGVGRVLAFKKVTARRLACELDTLLTCSQYAQAARAIAGELANIDGAVCAAEELIACLHPQGFADDYHGTAASSNGPLRDFEGPTPSSSGLSSIKRRFLPPAER
jgi:UDP:flavonoid glycosyltransferase YjiC (YdhE family)